VITRIAGAAKTTPTQLEVVDIAGLARGASRGEGLGNRFLGAIREVDAILHVLRCFDDADVTHVEGRIDPVRDAELVQTELLLADMASLERRVDGLTKRARGGEREAKDQLALIERILPQLEAGRPVRQQDVGGGGLAALRLLTSKPLLYVCNVDEAAAKTGNALSAEVAALAETEGAGAVIVSAVIEAELAAVEPAERAEYLAAIGLEQPGLHRVIMAGYQLLHLLTFFTAGPKEARAWTIERGTTAADAGGAIHTDFKRGFICAETIGYDDFIRSGGEIGAREAGKMRLEGRDYVVHDGDVIRFRFNV
jgi:GTP-binding protein YchF